MAPPPLNVGTRKGAAMARSNSSEKASKLISQDTPQGNDYLGTQLLLDIESNLLNYNNAIVKGFSKILNISSGGTYKILDFGAGTGDLADRFAKMTGISPDCLEIDEKLGRQISDRRLAHFRSLSMLTSKYDLIYSSNVLEHIENDVDTLKSLANLMTINGRIGIFVPASPILFSDLDRQVGHFRRYSRKDLKQKLELAGLEIEYIRFVDSLGFLASLLIRLIGFDKTVKFGGTKSLRLYDFAIFPISKVLDRAGLNRLIGKNIFLIAKKRE